MSQSSFEVPSTALMNSLLPAFEFTDSIESDGLGAVYFGIQKSLERQVAIKLYPPTLDNAPNCRESFEDSASALAALKHPNLIGIFDSGKVEGMHYLVLEFVPGKSLARSTKGQAVDFDQALNLIDGICNGLAHAHDKGITHGNLNPSNILLNRNADPKVGNFGFKRPNHNSTPSPCTAPEILNGFELATKRSDVYSVAAIFHELILGRPFDPESNIASTLPKCGREIDTVIKRATDPDPGRRMADARVFQRMLREAVEGGKPKPPRTEALKTSKNRPEERKPSHVPRVGFDWKLARNLVIIVALLFGINHAWKSRENAHANRAKENREVLAKEAAKREKTLTESIQNRKQQPVKSSPAAPQGKIVPVAQEQTETPEESLERLGSRLRSGSRAEMPTGTVRRGDSDYFLVTRKMNWAEAALFAEAHGAQPAIPVDGAEADWLGTEMAKTGSAWIGVGRGGVASWVTVAGIRWSPVVEPEGGGSFLAVNAGGMVHSESGETELPFIIQWQKDGSNPGTTANRLAATRASLIQAAPVFPPGTINHAGRHFLYVPDSVTWQQAKELAESAGGHLMVVSSGEESGHLLKLTVAVDSEDGIWLGGKLDGEFWRWITGEAWSSPNWAGDADAGSEGSALVFRPQKGLDSRDGARQASGFIIEWSADRDSARPNGTANTIGIVGVGELTAKAKALILAADKVRGKELDANIKKLNWDLDAFLRGQNKSGQAQWEPEVERLKKLTMENRFLSEQIATQEIKLSAEMARIAEYTARKQDETDTKFAEAAGKIRDSFVLKMTGIRDEATSSGQIKIVECANESISAAEDLAAWTGAFDLELPQ